MKSLKSVAVLSLLLTPLLAPAAVLFSDNFNTNSSALWTVNATTNNAAQQDAVFAFDYSTMGIPAAPGSSDTLGLRLRSNIPGSAAAPVTTRPAGTLSGLSVSPTGQNFGATYQLSFYAWVNFNGSANANGLADNANSEGGTHNVLFAVGTSGTVPLSVGNTTLSTGAGMDCIAFATTGDGGITSDYRIYPKSGTILPLASNLYQAFAFANTASYYMGIFPQQFAPAIQQTLSTAEYGGDAFNTQAGQTQNGAFGFAWHKVDIYKIKNNIRWFIDDYFIAGGDFSFVGALGGNNIAIGDSDVNTSTTRHPSLLFTLIDNLVVTDNPPRPTITSSYSGGTLKLSWPATAAGGLNLVSTTNLVPPITWTPAGVEFITSSNVTSTTLQVTNSATFYGLR